MQVAPGVDIRRLKPDFAKRLECVDKFYELHQEKMRVIPPFAGTREDLSFYCTGDAADIDNPIKMSDKFADEIKSCFSWDYDVIFELDRIIVKYNPM